MSDLDLHNFSERLESAVQRIQNHEEISEENKELAENYLNWLKIGDKRSDGRLFKYAICLKKILEHNLEKDFSTIDTSDQWKKQVQEILLDIQNSRYYHSDWAESTKEDYYKVVLDLIEFNEVSSKPRETRLIPSDFSAYGNRKKKGSGKGHTDPSDIPTPEEAKKFMRKIEDQGKPVINLRNNAMLAVMWDTGARIGEVTQTQLKHVTIRNGQVWINIQGNKQSADREIRMFQGAKTLKDWYTQGHPISEPSQHPDAYLFPAMWPKTSPEKPLNYETFTKKVVKKIHSQLHSNGEVNCRIKGETNHIWRKANTTFYIVNEWATYDKVLQRHGKSIANPTLPEYLRMMQSDVDQAIAENIGIDHTQKKGGGEEGEEFTHETARSMKDGDLLPKNCTECGELNRCYKETCQSCGTELPEAEMPDNMDAVTEEELVENHVDIQARLLEMQLENPDKSFSLNDIKQKIQEERQK